MTEAQSPPLASSLPNGNGNKINHLPKEDHSLDEKLSIAKSYHNTQEGDNATSHIPPLTAVTADLHARVKSFLSESHDPSSLLSRVQKQTRISLSVINEARSRYKLSELSISYNGGKDCLVMLILFLSSLHPEQDIATKPSEPLFTSSSPSNNTATASSEQPPHTSSSSSASIVPPEPHPTSIPAIYALPPHPFPSVESFVLSSSQYYHLSLTRCATSPPKTTIRKAFSSYLALHPNIRAIFVGTRRTDPHGATLTHFDRTDHGWPDFMRIHPVIDWHYAEIWAFIRHLEIEYCPLYDEGYTSLGGTNDTHPNPKLMRKTAGSTSQDGVGNGNRHSPSGESSSNNTYRPAYELMDDDEERLGRD